jgi:excisionase family DNA binding protein
MTPTPDRVTVNIRQAAALVGVSRRTIYHWLKAGKLETRRTIGGGLRIYEDSLWQKPTDKAPQ